MKLFRFQSINTLTLQNLTNQKNWVADPYGFNDPFEFSLLDGFRMEYTGFKTMSQMEKANIKKFRDALSQLGVVCYSSEPINNLLWAHYANYHRGMCLVFDVTKEKESELYKVKYQKAFPEINLTDDANTHEEITTIVTTKSIEWKYENEYRQVFTKKNEPHVYPGELVEIIFGCRTPVEDIRTVTEIVGLKSQNIMISKMHIDQFQYGLVKSTIGKKREIPIFWGSMGMRI